MRPVCAVLAALLLVQPAPAQQEELVEKVRESINKGVRYLREQENNKGNFEHTAALIAQVREGGVTALCVVALLNAGVPPDDPLIQRSLKYLRTLGPSQTYTVGLQTMAFCLAGEEVDRERVRRNLKWLAEQRVAGGWNYDERSRGHGPDHSINQYALLGIHEARLAGFDVDRDMLATMHEYYNTSGRAGAWKYRNAGGPSLTMTTAGLCNLLITGQDLDRKKALEADGSDKTCGKYDFDRTAQMAFEWISDKHPNKGALSPSPFYGLYGIERTGRLTGQRFFGDKDWYRIGCEWLVERQQDNGSWKGTQGGNNLDYWPPVATSFSLLFLSKGRTPVLISKFAHGDPDAKFQGWNRKRDDARHLVEFASRELFDKYPLAWQVFDSRQVGKRDAKELAAELLQSPIAYINGHMLTMGKREEDVLREFLDNGGFLFAEACCNEKQFDQQFRALIAKLTDTELQPLGRNHPVWTASGKFTSDPRDFPLEGVQKGCKTIAIYSPRALAGYWENNDTKSEKGKKAFELAANVIAYATGLEKPKDRLTPVEIIKKGEGREPLQGYLEVVHLASTRDSLPVAPKAMDTVMGELNKLRIEGGVRKVKRNGREVPDVMSLTSEDAVALKFFYMHDRNGFRVPATQDLVDLKFTLENGGVLFADAACGSKQFDEAFRKLVAALELEGIDPKTKKKRKYTELEPIDPGEERKKGGLYSREVNGQVIETVRCRREENGKPSKDFSEGPPRLEGVKINGRWAIVYSRYDIGCALEKHQSTDCLGHDFDSAKLLARAVALYALRP